MFLTQPGTCQEKSNWGGKGIRTRRRKERATGIQNEMAPRVSTLKNGKKKSENLASFSIKR